MASLHIINNLYCKIEDETDLDFLSSINSELSFILKGAEYMPGNKFSKKGNKFRKWDGKVKLLDKNLKFSLGLLDRVKEFYYKNNKQFSIIDDRLIDTDFKSIDIIDKLKKIDIIPYEYQSVIPDTAIDYNRGIIKVATGGGKTLIAALIAAKFGKKTNIYVIGKDLLYQFHSFFSKIFDNVGIIGDGNCDIKDINIVSVWSVGKAFKIKKIILDDDSCEEKEVNKIDEIKNLIKDCQVHIYDECHMAACDTIQAIYTNSNPEYIYGLSGSPWRDDGADLLIESILGKRIIDISASYLIDNGFLAKPIIYFKKVPKTTLTYKDHYKTIYKDYITDNEYRNALIIKYAKYMVDKGFQVLILYSTLSHGKTLYDMMDIDCEVLNGKDSNDKKADVKARLSSGELKCVLASKIFDIGVDIPSLSALIIGFGGKSTVKALQRIGRVIRKYPNKKMAAIIDFEDHAPHLIRHSKIRKEIYESEKGFEVHVEKR